MCKKSRKSLHSMRLIYQRFIKLNYLPKKVRADENIAIQADAHAPLLIAATVDESCPCLNCLHPALEFFPSTVTGSSFVLKKAQKIIQGRGASN